MTDSPELLGAARVHDLAARLGLRPTKQWGQNFVVDANTVRRIVRLAGVSLGPVRRTLHALEPASAGRPHATEADLMRRLHRYEVVDLACTATRSSTATCRGPLRWIGTNTDLSMVASAFDLDPLAHAEPDRGVRLVNKTGTISTVRADVGVVEGPAANAAYAVLASRADDVDLRDAVLADMRRIGQIIRDHVGG